MTTQAYQEISNGKVIRYADMDGNTVNLPDPCESDIVRPLDTTSPLWAIEGMSYILINYWTNNA